jgi:hypothetical protein
MYGNEMKQAYPNGGGAMAGLAVGAIEQKRQLEVPNQLETLERNIKGCVQGVEHMESRLGESILRPMGPQSAGTPPSPSAVQSTSLSNRLQDMNSGLSILNERIQSLIARLEA